MSKNKKAPIIILVGVLITLVFASPLIYGLIIDIKPMASPVKIHQLEQKYTDELGVDVTCYKTEVKTDPSTSFNEAFTPIFLRSGIMYYFKAADGIEFLYYDNRHVSDYYDTMHDTYADIKKFIEQDEYIDTIIRESLTDKVVSMMSAESIVVSNHALNPRDKNAVEEISRLIAEKLKEKYPDEDFDIILYANNEKYIEKVSAWNTKTIDGRIEQRWCDTSKYGLESLRVSNIKIENGEINIEYLGYTAPEETTSAISSAQDEPETTSSVSTPIIKEFPPKEMIDRIYAYQKTDAGKMAEKTQKMIKETLSEYINEKDFKVFCDIWSKNGKPQENTKYKDCSLSNIIIILSPSAPDISKKELCNILEKAYAGNTPEELKFFMGSYKTYNTMFLIGRALTNDAFDLLNEDLYDYSLIHNLCFASNADTHYQDVSLKEYPIQYHTIKD